MYAPYGAFWAIVPEILPRRVAGGAIALINMVGSLGSFLGAFAVGTLSSATGSATSGNLFMAGALAVASAFTFLVRLPTPSLAAEPKH
jgi:nitrate/nitrite transporter NarK